MASSFTSGVDVSWKAALASQKDADSPRLLLASELRSVLANPEQYGLAMGVWFMIDADESLVAAHAPHTLAGRLGLSPTALETLAQEIGLYRQANVVTKMLMPHRTQGGPLALSLLRPGQWKERVR